MKLLKSILLLVMLCGVTLSYAQDVDDLFMSPSGVQNDVVTLLNKAKGNTAAQPDVAIEDLENALELSVNQNSIEGKAFSYMYIGGVNYHHERYDLALRNYRRAIKQFKKVDGNGKAANAEAEINHCKKYMGLTYWKGNNPASAAATLTEYLNYVQPKGNKDETLETLNLLGEIYLELGNTTQSEYYYQEAVRYAESLNDTVSIINTYNGLGNLYLNSNNNAQAVDVYTQQYDLAQQSNDTLNMVQSSVNVGNAFNDAQNPVDAQQWQQQATDLALGNNTIDGASATILANGAYNTGLNYNWDNNYVEAIPLLEASIEQFNKVEGNLEERAEAYKALSESYAGQKDYEKALENYQEYVVLIDSIQEERELKQVQASTLNSILDEREETISSLEQNMELTAAKVEALEKDQLVGRIMIWSLIGGLAIVIIAAALIYRSSQQKRRANQLLALRSLRTQMNPHFIFNSLNSVNSFIAINDERSANKYLSEFSKLMRNVLENSKYDFVSLGNEIRLLELYLGLEHFRFKDKFDYSFVFDETIDTEELQVPPMLIQPYIENAIWHGLRYKEDKGHLRIDISRQNGHLKVLVEDDGIGRSRSAELKTRNQKDGTSTGLKNIKERLGIINELHHTNLKVEINDLHPEADDAGTRVELQIPCNLSWE